MLAAGFAVRDITPPLGTPCALGLDNEAIEIFDPVHVRVLILSDAGHTIVILAAEVLGVYQYADEILRREIAARVNVPEDSVIVHATHTHQSPGLRVEFGEYLAAHGLRAYSPEFWQSVRTASVDAALEAARTLAPVELRYGQAPVAGIAGNRRLRMPDGSIVMRGSRDTERRRAYPEGYIDPLVRVLCLKRETDEIILTNYCCHPTASGGDEGPYITADFPGYAIAQIEREIDGARGIHLTGCCGNINPGKYTGLRSRQEDARGMGEALAEAVIVAREAAERVPETALRFKSQPVNLPVSDSLEVEQAYEAQVARSIDEYKASKAVGETIPGGGPLRRQLCALLLVRRLRDGMLPTRVCGLACGDLDMLFLPGECFLELDHAIRGQYTDRRVICVENCDYTVSYVPVPEAYTETARGYEAGVACVGPGAFGVLGTTAVELFADQRSE